MRRPWSTWLLVAVTSAVPAVTAPAAAQVLGTFPWQVQPFCNVVTLTLRTSPSGYVVEGIDDQCGASNAASAVGFASFGAGGQVSLNFSIVTTPNGTPVHVAALVSPANGDGTWTDSLGHSGTFKFYGRQTGLPVRPVRSSGLGAGVVTETELAAGAVTAAKINRTEVQTRVTGTCSAGQAVTGVGQNGSVTCASTVDAAVQFKGGGMSSRSMPASTMVTVTWDTLVYNDGGGTFAPAAGTYTVPSDGLYLMTTAVAWTSGTSTRACTYLDVNGGIVGLTCGLVPSTTDIQMMTVTAVHPLVAGDVILVRAQQQTAPDGYLQGLPATHVNLTVTKLRP